jgi:hypothetical protein
LQVDIDVIASEAKQSSSIEALEFTRLLRRLLRAMTGEKTFYEFIKG